MTFQDADRSELFAAIRDGRLEDVATAIARHPSLVNARDADGSTPLHEAAFYDDGVTIRRVVNDIEEELVGLEAAHDPLRGPHRSSASHRPTRTLPLESCSR
jgi:ankyrin repeat protein